MVVLPPSSTCTAPGSAARGAGGRVASPLCVVLLASLTSNLPAQCGGGTSIRTLGDGRTIGESRTRERRH